MSAANCSSEFISNTLSLSNELKSIVTDERFGFDSPVFLITIIIMYLLFVYKIGPSMMLTRQPYKLKEFLAVYNILQVVACLYLIKSIWVLAGWDIFNFSKCAFYEPNSPGRKSFDDFTYFTFWLKVIEFTDTVIFVLRKKQNQITYLHVFHHASTLSIVYLLAKYHKGNGVVFPTFLNTSVHVIMYSYYFFANICGRDVIRRLMFIKKSITIIQMIQFVFILTQAAVMWKNCNVPAILRAYICLVVGVFFYGFYDFYKKTYGGTQQHDDKLPAKQC